MIEVEVFRLIWDENQNSPIVLLIERDDESKVLPIWIGHVEAQAIAMGLTGKKYIRPLTHDLTKMILDGFGASLLRVEINAMENSTYYSRLLISRENEIISIDARPSDAIALAVRTGAPIYISESIAMFQMEDIINNHSQVDPEVTHKERVEKLRKMINRMRPEEFGNTE